MVIGLSPTGSPSFVFESGNRQNRRHRKLVALQVLKNVLITKFSAELRMKLRAFYIWLLYSQKTKLLSKANSFSKTQTPETTVEKIIKELHEASEESKNLAERVKTLQAQNEKQGLIIASLQSIDCSINSPVQSPAQSPTSNISSPEKQETKEESSNDISSPMNVLDKAGDSTEIRLYNVVQKYMSGFQHIFKIHCTISSEKIVRQKTYNWIITEQNCEGYMSIQDWISCAKDLLLSPELLSKKSVIEIFRQCAKLIEGDLVLGLEEMISCFVVASTTLVENAAHNRKSSEPHEQLLVLLFRLYNSETHFPGILEDITGMRQDIHNLSPRSIRQENLLKPNLCFDKEEEEEEENESKFAFVFTYYCAFGDRRNSKLMSATKFCKMCRECKVVNSSSIRQQELDICFQAILADFKRQSNKKEIGSKAFNDKIPYHQIQKVMALVGRRLHPEQCSHSSRKAYEIIRDTILANFGHRHKVRENTRASYQRKW